MTNTIHLYISPAGNSAWWGRLATRRALCRHEPLVFGPEGSALAEDSPAWVMGFRPIDLSDVGPRPAERRD